MNRFLALSLFLLSVAPAFAQENAPLETLRFRAIGPAAMSGRITAIACDPRDSRVIYAGAASGGVWRSRSGGTDWKPIFDEAPTQSIGALAISPDNPDEIWVGTGEGNPRNSQNFGAGVFKSIDGGQTWACVGLEKTRTIHRIIVHPHDPKTVWVASLGSAYGPNDERGVFKTTDGGKTWRKVLFVNDLTGCGDLVLDPANPNKLIAAMWEYRRWPWFFKSGGPGSGLYTSVDGGESWTRRTERDGLPEGELGRIGPAIAPSNPDVVYALVEARENALYKSTDSGKSWRKMADKNMGDRPFYYGEIFVDPRNENTVYSVHSRITRSIDGGRTFDNWVGFWDIHPDHHAFWINPNDPKHIIDGNDGGLNITYDGGQTWRYADNIPVGQFYHINLDNEQPYNLYGGLQDNGSWVGPSAVWKRGGMRNSEWREVYFGDGFDVVPQPGNSRYCYAMSQGGELAHIDIHTGNTRYIKPLHPEGRELRFNWNAAIAQDPHRPEGLYFGSQFLHYSPDMGSTWRILSPDLTTNDTAKMHQGVSGGLTIDATNAENFCTIIAIAPSPAEKGTIWVGSDDGRLHLTRDGGKNWDDLTKRLPGLPENAWIPQIELSAHNPGEAFVVANNYRQNDWEPYLYHTKDYGKKWKRIANAKNVRSFCLSVVQDPTVPELLFLGTDQGLYVSLDYGDTWTHWPSKGLPSVPVQDMKIHPRDGDLVLGTFGRAIWILDNLEPLRALARSNGKLMEKPFAVFRPQDAVLANYVSYDGPRFVADETFKGQNKSAGARIPIWLNPGAAVEKPADTKPGGDTEKNGDGKQARKKEEKVTVTVCSDAGDTLRRFTATVDSFFSVISWDLDTRGIYLPAKEKPKKDADEPGGGPSVMPGKYRIGVSWREFSDSTTLQVLDDPRTTPVPAADREAHRAVVQEWQRSADRSVQAYEQLREAEKIIGLVEAKLENVPDSLKKEVTAQAKTLRDSIGALKEVFFTHKEAKGIQRNPNTLNALHYKALQYINATGGAPGESARVAMETLAREREHVIERINNLMQGPWLAYRIRAEQLPDRIFSNFDRL
ncbi:MAG: hypothetical protein SFV52_16520 [Saprospiraceae bacterium]|nr:hypothetical protein [Saprospiraceae bacterium]